MKRMKLASGQGARGVVLWVVFAAFLICQGGCAARHGEKTREGARGAVRFSAIVAHGARVSPEAVVNAHTAERRLLALVPHGILPTGYKLRWATKGDGLWSVTGEKQDQRLPEEGIWIFGSEWKLIGRVTGLPAGSASVFGTWDSAGRRLAVIAYGGSTSLLVVGLVTPPSLRFRELLRIGSSWPNLVWAGNRLVVTSSGERNIILALDPVSGRTTTLYENEQSATDRTTITDLMASPDGAHLAFEMDQEHGYRGSAKVFVLDLTTGGCAQVAYEEGSDSYYHYLVGWQSSAVLAFARVVSQGPENEVYRVVLKLPLRGPR